jgi:Divergent InlB B-repeat domain
MSAGYGKVPREPVFSKRRLLGSGGNMPVRSFKLLSALAVASLLVAASVASAATITIGETKVLTVGDGDNANLNLAQNAVLSQPATIESLSFYVTSPSGSLRLGIYDATGPSGGPGKLLAQTASFTTVKGWNTEKVTTPVALKAGTYWLSYLPSSNGLTFVKGTSTGVGLKYYAYSFGPLPATYSRSPSSDPYNHWSLYATLTTTGTTTAVNGQCGSSNTGLFTTAPTTNLCTAGTASSLSGAGPWSWGCAGSGGGTNASCTANLARALAVSASPSTAGTVSGSGTFASGTAHTVSAAANAGYQFTGWTSNGTVVSTSTSYTLTLTSNVTLVANFVPLYQVSASAAPSAGGIAVGGGSFVAGSSQKVTAIPNSGYTFNHWTANGSVVSTAPSYTFTVTGNTTLVADLSTTAPTQYTITGTAAPSAGGTVVGSGTFPSGTSHTVTATPASGYKLVNWTANGSVVSTSPSYTFTLNSNVTLVATFNAVQTSGNIMPDVYYAGGNSSSGNWTTAGLVTQGGIPNRTTVCATINPIGGGADDANAIKNAINNCPAGQVVQLGSAACAPNCAFSVKMADIPIYITKGIVLRGYGSCNKTSSPYCQTSITVSDGLEKYTGGTCAGGTCTEFPLLAISPSTSVFDIGWASCGLHSTATGCGEVALGADAAQGQTTIQVASTSQFTVGRWVLIDEASGAGWQPDPLVPPGGGSVCGSIWASSDWLNNSPSPATNRVAWPKGQNCGYDFGTGQFPTDANGEGCWLSNCDRVTSEIHQVASIGSGPCPGTNCTLTFTSPLTIGFRISGGHKAQVYSGPNNQAGTNYIGMVQFAGIENLTTMRSSGGGIVLQMCAYCWLKNVEVSEWTGGGITFSYAWRSQLDTVLVDNIWRSINNGGEYPVSLNSSSTEVLVQNSIIHFSGKGMVAESGGAGSVVAYNYQDDTFYDAQSPVNDYWLDMGLNGSHFTGQHHILFEGNWADNCDNDNTHGNSAYHTYFRNQCAGVRTPFTNPSNGLAVSDQTGVAQCCGVNNTSNPPGPLRAAGMMAYDYWMSFVGNVLGTSGITTAGNGWTYQGDWSAHRIWMLGWATQQGGQDSNLANGAYMFRNGNYDYVNNSIADWQAGYQQTLPNSIYLSSTPSFFASGAACTYPWPWVTPTGSSQIQKNSCGGSGLPAKARWMAGTPFVQP